MNRQIEEAVRAHIRDVPDFPKKGIVFKDITPLLEAPDVCNQIIEYLTEVYKKQNLDAVVGIESRGFLFGFPLAMCLGIPFIPVRKKGKLPGKTLTYSYKLEYGSAVMEIHEGSIQPGWNVLIHDDLLATGGTAAAAAELVKMREANPVAFNFIIELEFLKGREKVEDYTRKIINLAAY